MTKNATVLKAAEVPSAANMGQPWKAPLTRKQHNTPMPAMRRRANGQKTNVQNHALTIIFQRCPQNSPTLRAAIGVRCISGKEYPAARKHKPHTSKTSAAAV